MREQLGAGEVRQALLIGADLVEVDRVESGGDEPVDRLDHRLGVDRTDHRRADRVVPEVVVRASKCSGRAISDNTDGGSALFGHQSRAVPTASSIVAAIET